MKTLLCCLSTLMILVVTGAHEGLSAQAASDVSGHRTRVPVTIALSELLSERGAQYTIYRSPGQAHQDVILLRADADEQVLSEAVRVLLLARRHGGDVTAATSRLRGRQSADLQERAPAALPWAARVLRDLRVADVRTVAGIGTVKAVEIWLPRQNGTGVHR